MLDSEIAPLDSLGMEEQTGSAPTLKRDLGTIESYAVLIGILVGAGIFRVTSEATVATSTLR